jgi:energy-coupling factor transporter ATP-binding protein EcfA2
MSDSDPVTPAPNLTIAALHVENVKRLQAVELAPDGKSVVVTGRNAQGKSSLLDAIAYAMGGASLCPTEPVRKGQDKAEATVTLSNGLVVKRTWTAKGSYLSVTNAEGFSARSPQKVLDDLAGTLTFDPLAFSRMKPAEQRSALLDLLGVQKQLDDIERREAAHTAARREAGRERDRLQAAAEQEARALPAGEPQPRVDVAALAAEVSKAAEMKTTRANELAAADRKIAGHSTAIDQATRRKEDLSRQVVRVIEKSGDRVAELQRQIEQVKAEAKARADELDEQILTARAEEDQLVLDAQEADAAKAALLAKHAAEPLPDVEAIQAKLNAAATINKAADLREKLEGLFGQARAKAGDWDRHDKELAALSATKTALLASAKLPVEGLGFTACGVTLNGIPLEQCSSAETLRLSTAVAMAANPTLRVLLIRDASLLDNDGMAAIAQAADSGGYQLWIERVGDHSEPGTVLIEDGSVVEDRIAEAA